MDSARGTSACDMATGIARELELGEMERWNEELMKRCSWMEGQE
jgi:hypothetical protein